jgi:hypothetical protein
MTLASEGDGYEGLDLNAEQKDLCDFYKGERGDEQPEYQGTQASEGAPDEAPIVEEAMTGDEEDDEESHGGRQEERETNDDDMEEEESAEGNS